MGELSSAERESVERAAAQPMLDQVLAWSAVNSGSRNLAGLERMADRLPELIVQARPVPAVAGRIRRISLNAKLTFAGRQ